jgi:hypothetical protein
MLNINWTDKIVDYADLKPYEGNPREMTKENRSRLKNSLQKFGQVKPLLVNKDLTILGGNQRITQLKNKKVWVRFPNRQLNKEESKAVLIIHNNKIGDFDFSLLAELGYTDDELVDTFGFDRELVNEMGFDFDDLDFDDMDDDVIIKKLIVSFPKDVDVEQFTKKINDKLGVETFEESLLILTKKYENSNIG